MNASLIRHYVDGLRLDADSPFPSEAEEHLRKDREFRMELLRRWLGDAPTDEPYDLDELEDYP